MSLSRIFRHLIAEGSARRHFPERVLDAIQSAVAAGEQRHQEQVCFAAEGALPLRELWRGRAPRERAREVFAHLRVWDTEHNTGVLIYVLLADRAIEILADRGIASRVAESDWVAICTRMQAHFAAGEFERGAVEGVTAVSDILSQYFPAEGTTRANELPDRPVVL